LARQVACAPVTPLPIDAGPEAARMAKGDVADRCDNATRKPAATAFSYRRVPGISR